MTIAHHLRLGVLALLGGAPSLRAQALPDVAHLGTAPQIAETYLHGFRPEYISVDIENPVTKKTERCKIRFVLHEGIGKLPPIVLLHGLTDTGSGFGFYADRLIELKRDYKQLIWLDLPRHGLSDCDVVRTIPEAAQAVMEAFEKLRVKRDLAEPKAFVAHSMGNTVAPYFYPKYPKARYILVANPLLNPKPWNQLVDFIMKIDSTEGAREFLRRTGKDPIPHVPLANSLIRWSVYDAMKDRIIRSRELIVRLDLDAAVRKTLEMDPQQVEMILGQNDELTPSPDLNDAIRQKFASRIRYVKCGHNIHRDCPEFLPERF